MALSPTKFERLPTFAHPEHYSLRLKVDLNKEFSFTGQAIIDVTITEATKFLRLHSQELHLKKVTLVLADGKELSDLKSHFDKRWNTVTLDLPAEVAPQSVQLRFDYTGVLHAAMQGFYRSTYKTPSGETRHLASTQFESEWARRVFPCFDEPRYKARFAIELEIDESLTGLSCMHVQSETKTTPGYKLLKFAPTPIMSSYLVAFAVGEFEYIETTTKGGILTRLYTVPGKKQQGHFALDVASKSLDFFTDFFDFKMPLKKVDLLCVPDFSMGAMENWGLITYRDAALLVSEQTSHQQRVRVALVTAHEVSHFWFGNLTTPEWWNALWLKIMRYIVQQLQEGFASFCMFLAVADIRPELDAWTEFIHFRVNDAITMDAMASSHPIEVEINDPADLSSIYDAITYTKSSVVLRMLYKYLGHNKFRDGLRDYCQTHQYQCTKTKDLWDALTRASGEDIAALMSSWTKQQGLPLIDVRQETAGDGNARLRLKQTRFLADGTTDDQLWNVPLIIRYASKDGAAQTTTLTFAGREQTVVVGDNLLAENGYININADFTAFIRVRYDEGMLRRLLEAVQAGKLSALDRYFLVNNLWALTSSGHTTAEAFLKLFTACTNEGKYVVWGALSNALNVLRTTFAHTDATLCAKFDKFVCAILSPVATRLGWTQKADEGDALCALDAQVPLVRRYVLALLCTACHDASIAEATRLFYEYANENKTIHPELRGLVFATAAAADPKAIAKLQQIYETSDRAEVQCDAVVAMAESQCPSTWSQVFKYAVLDSHVRGQDAPSLFAGAAKHAQTQNALWAFFKQHHDAVAKLCGGHSGLLFQRCYRACGSNQCTSTFAADFANFYNTTFNNDECSMQRAFDQTLEGIKLNERLAQSSRESAAKFLAQY